MVSGKNVVASFLPFTSLNYTLNNSLKLLPVPLELIAAKQHLVLHPT